MGAGNRSLGRAGKRMKSIRFRKIVAWASLLTFLAVTATPVVASTSSAAPRPLVASGAGDWTASTAPALGLSPAPISAHLNAVSCATATSCVAVGTYSYGSTYYETVGLIETGTLVGGAWHWKDAAAPTSGLNLPPLLATGLASGQVTLNGVSCGTATTCVAVGTYTDGTTIAHAGQEGLIESGTASGDSWSWTASNIPLGTLNPKPYNGAGTNPGGVGLFSISCAGVTCVATGGYGYVPTGIEVQDTQPLIWAGTAGSWKQESVPTGALKPAAASAATNFMRLNAVSCASTTSCAIASSYDDVAGTAEGFVAQGNPATGVWSTSNDAVPTGDGVALSGISCPSTTSCIVTGTTGSHDVLEVGTLKGATRTWVIQKTPSMTLFTGASVSCPTTALCIATGQGYAVINKRYLSQFEVGTESGGQWTWVLVNAPTKNLTPALAANSWIIQNAIACQSTTCVAVGSYSDASQVPHAAIETLPISGGSSVTGTIEYDYAAGALYARGVPFAGDAQVTPARDTAVDILAATRTECSADTLSTVYTSDSGLYTSAPLPASQKYFCIQVVAATQYSDVVPYTSQNVASANAGTLPSDASGADASKTFGPEELASSGDTTFSWKADDVNDTIDQALDIDNAMVTGARWLEGYGPAPKFANILYPYPTTQGVSNFAAQSAVGEINKDDAFDWGVLLHEYGHFVAALLGVDNTSRVANSNHNLENNLTNTEANKSQGLAISWNEGFADFFSQMVQDAMGTASLGLKDVGASPPIYIDQTPSGTISIELDVGGDATKEKSLGEDNEVSVARVLWAMYALKYRGLSGSVAFIKLLSSAMTTDATRTLSGAVDAVLVAQKASPWVPDVGRPSTNVEVPVHYDEAAAATTYGPILSSQHVAPSIVNASASGRSIDVSWTTGQPAKAKDQLNLFLVQFWNASWTTLLTEQIVADRSPPFQSTGGSEVYEATQIVPASWRHATVNVVVLGWSTQDSPPGLSVPITSPPLLAKGLNPLTGPYISAPETVKGR
jgi:hypothetical protein